MPGPLIVTVAFADGHSQRWPLPEGQAADGVLEELRQVIVGGQWFRVPGGTKVYSPHAIVSVDVAEAGDQPEHPSVAHKLGEAVAIAMHPDEPAASGS
jgi:hypothetical protein